MIIRRITLKDSQTLQITITDRVCGVWVKQEYIGLRLDEACQKFKAFKQAEEAKYYKPEVA